MEQKGNKVFLPNSYDQFLLQKKKNNKQPQANKSIVSNQTNYNQFHLKLNRQSTIQQQHGQQNNNNTQLIIVQKTIHSEYKKMFDQFQNSRFYSIKQRIQNQMKKLQQKTIINIPSVSQILNSMEIQSFQNIMQIKQQYKLPPNKRNIQKMERMLCFNKFFVILNRYVKIYQEGDIDDYMYVIVKGCVKQYERKTTTYNQKILVNFVSHYQGSNFGQVQSYGENQTKGKRYHTIQTTQKTYLIRILNNFYRQLISNSAQDDFQKKLNSLMKSNIFKETSKLMVTPLLSTLDKHILPFGKILIKQDDEVKRLYFLAQGTLKIVYLDRAKKHLKHLNIEQKPQNFYLNSKPKSQSKSRSKSKNYSIHNTFYYPQQVNGQKSFIYGDKKVVGQQLEYNDQILFRQLRIGDFFGGKSFISQLDKQKKAQRSQFFDTSIRAKLSIISSSTQCLVYSIDEKKFFSLSQNLQRLIISGLMQQPYFDQYNIEQKIQSQKQWKKYSQNLIANIIKSKKDKSYSFRS